jgi:hypothetical protein
MTRKAVRIGLNLAPMGPDPAISRGTALEEMAGLNPASDTGTWRFNDAGYQSA